MNSNEVVLAVAKDNKVPLFFKGSSLNVCKLRIENNVVYEDEEICIENIEKIKWISFNAFTVISKDKTYCIFVSKNSLFNKLFIFPYRKPKLNQRLIGRQLTYLVGLEEETEIITTPIKKIKKIADNLYMIKTRHVYFAIC